PPICSCLNGVWARRFGKRIARITVLSLGGGPMDVVQAGKRLLMRLIVLLPATMAARTVPGSSTQSHRVTLGVGQRSRSRYLVRRPRIGGIGLHHQLRRHYVTPHPAFARSVGPNGSAPDDRVSSRVEWKRGRAAARRLALLSGGRSRMSLRSMG